MWHAPGSAFLRPPRNPVELVSVKLGNRLHCFWIETWTHWCNFLLLCPSPCLPPSTFRYRSTICCCSNSIYAIACVLWFHCEIKIGFRQWFFAWVLSSFSPLHPTFVVLPVICVIVLVFCCLEVVPRLYDWVQMHQLQRSIVSLKLQPSHLKHKLSIYFERTETTLLTISWYHSRNPSHPQLVLSPILEQQHDYILN